MSRAPWRSRPTGRHAAGGRGRDKSGGPPPARALPDHPAGPAEPAEPAGKPLSRPPVLPTSANLLGAPTLAEVVPAETVPLVSPVTDAARAAVASSAARLPTFVPPGADPLITIDALGRKCPIPIIWLAQQIGQVPVGSVIAVLADDPAAYPDIPAWCGLKSHECVFRLDYATGWAFGVRRRY